MIVLKLFLMLKEEMIIVYSIIIIWGGGGILLSCSFKECKFEHCVVFFLLPFADINISKCEIKEKMGV